ncbi:DUF2058 domain-containing protein, partial [Lysobacter lacus]
MSDTLRDQLLGLGFKPPAPVARPEKRDERRPPRPAGAPRGDSR